MTSGTCVNTLSQHTASVYSVSWSPNGFHVASGSYDNTVNIWDIRNQGKLIKSIHSEGGVFQVNWSVDGDYLAICSAGGKVIVVYLKTMMSLLQ